MWNDRYECSEFRHVNIIEQEEDQGILKNDE